MQTGSHWYMRDVFYWRTGASVAWSVLLQPVSVAVYVFLTSVNLLHPYLWVTDWLSVLFSWHGIGYSCLLGFITCIQAWSNILFYQATPTVHLNRLSIIWNVIRPSHFLYIVFHMMLAGLLASCCGSLIGGPYSTLVRLCKEDGETKECLSEEHLFLVLYGMYMGILYSVNYFMQGSNYFEFPAIQQLKFFQVKGYMSWSLYNSTIGTLKTSAYFYLMYFIFGSIPNMWLLYNLDVAAAPLALHSVRGLLNLSLLWNTWLTGTMIYHLWGLSLFLFKIFNTEVYRFPIETTFADKDDTCLYKVLSQYQHTLVQYLAFQDVASLAEYGSNRRKEVFALSQPGGHPYNWNRICTECLSTIESLTARLMAHEEKVTNGMAQNKRSSTDKDGSKAYMTMSEVEPYHRGSVTSPLSTYNSVFETPPPRHSRPPHESSYVQQPTDLSWAASPSVHQRSFGRMRNEKVSDTPSHRQQHDHPQQKPMTKFWSHWRLEYHIKQFRIMDYLLTPLPEAVNRSLFADAQLHIWALEALSSFVSSSYREDTFGVVQGSFSDIMTTMLALQIAVDKHFKLPTSVSKKNLRDFRPLKAAPVHPDDGLRLDLKSTVKTSLHRVIATFGPNLKNVSAAPEYKKRLLELMEYKE